MAPIYHSDGTSHVPNAPETLCVHQELAAWQLVSIGKAEVLRFVVLVMVAALVHLPL